MRRLRWAGTLLASALLVFSAQAGAASNPQASKVKQTAMPVWTLAIDGPRVAYASGGRIRVWNLATGATAVVKGRYGSASRYTNTIAAQVAISGKRVAWIKRNWVGNTEAGEKLYTSTIAGRVHLRAHSYRFARDDPSATRGSWIAGVVGSGNLLAVSSWKSVGPASSSEKLSRITPTGLKTIATGPGAIVAESGDGAHIAVLRDTAAWPSDDGNQPLSLTPTAGIYSTAGALERQVALSPPSPDSVGIQVALAGKHLVVLTTGLEEPAGPATVTLQVYDWTTGTLLDTWPVGIQKYPGEVSFAVHEQLAAVEGPASLHLVNLATGKDVVIGPSSHTDSPPAIDSRGLVYAVTPHLKSPGKLVFVPMAKLLALMS